jgi:hypothetical protein
VYSVLTSRYDSAANSPSARMAMASVGAMPATASVSDPAAYLASFPQARAPEAASTKVAASEPVFRSLYQTGARAEPVSDTVRELWGNRASPSTASGHAAKAPVQGIGLFSDSTGVFSG